MTMHEWFCEYWNVVGEQKIGGTNITESRQAELEEWAEQVKAKKRNGASKD